MGLFLAHSYICLHNSLQSKCSIAYWSHRLSYLLMICIVLDLFFKCPFSYATTYKDPLVFLSTCNYSLHTYEYLSNVGLLM
jgi:hypothetical protein